MKTLLSIAICMFVALGSQAQNRIFQKQKEHKEKINQQKQQFIKQHQLSSTGRAAQVEKLSFWDTQTNAWGEQLQVKRTFTNGLLTSLLRLNYAGTDTQLRETYTYDSQNRLTQRLQEQYNTGQFFPFQRITYSRTGTGTQTFVELYESYDGTNFTPDARTTRVTDDRGNERLYKNENYNNGIWETNFGYSTYITYFGTSAKMELELDSMYDSFSQQFIPNYRIEKQYKPNGEVEKIFSSYYDNGQWIEETKDSVIYNNNLPFELYSSEYDSTNGYVPFGKFYNLTWNNFDPNVDLYYNEPDGYTIAIFLGIYVDALRYSITRPDAFGTEIELEESFMGIAWVPSGRYSTIFDSNRNLLEESSETYDAGTWSYQDGRKFQNSYDMNNDLSEIVQQWYDSVDSAFVNQTRTEFSNYTNVILGLTNQQKSLNATLYPNPSNDGNVFVRLDATSAGTVNYSIFSTSGQEIEANTFEASAGKNTFSLPTLDAGFYIVHLQSAEGVSQFKVFVK